ncbi:RluA family pseudouridine synthase [Candidatus Kinetoplastidibacterium crithidiae]|uniref:Pseudouridine synthase n=1 Tax=Candidatus Kinetoplastidibacterium crithidiae TCC036E TaxID=1208918 RepID=M1L4X8_9PROT|nr:RluA family pseudouridine synthase [Candidatus Kinetoplastibacterium crithidii]AFZ82621.1 23S rRNA pseudouridine1911/1915/1917 synthase [Candidatus Kinetoplastibacterium crithidii (ex Angomonas deanei ATCC 30255)]AGF47718.1 ribosomal large subunit pseudouridine synthase D [Candidatus Kinetoplastibacterium crithidii TCC036E]
MFNKYNSNCFNESFPKNITVPEGISDRLDKILSYLMPDYSRERIKQWIKNNHVLVNGKLVKIRHNVQPGDLITVWVQPTLESLSFSPENIIFEVIDESSDWIVINKPAGLVTHPGSGNWKGTLLNGLLYKYPELFYVPRAGIVHRLDKNTSGVMVVARTIESQLYFVRQLQLRNISREYLAIVHGHISTSSTINKPIGRDANNPIKMGVKNIIAPKEAITHFKPIVKGITTNGHNITQVACKLETGRTHQIRVHLSSIGNPILGDSIYNSNYIIEGNRHMLHSRFLNFTNIKGISCKFNCRIPEDMTKVIDSMRWFE